MLGQVYIHKFCFWLFIIRHERRIFPTMPNYNLPETIFLVHLRREKKGRGNQPEEITCKEYKLKAKQKRTGGIAVKERFTFVYTVLISCFDKSEGRGDYLLQRIRMILQLITTGRQKCMFKNEILTSFISFLNIHSKGGDDRDTERHPLLS